MIAGWAAAHTASSGAARATACMHKCKTRIHTSIRTQYDGLPIDQPSRCLLLGFDQRRHRRLPVGMLVLPAPNLPPPFWDQEDVDQ